MLIQATFDEWEHKGHQYGECMSHSESDLMYVHIPKNASSWTKPNLQDWGWQFYNYHLDGLNKTAIVVLRDPVERWLSGIAEYFTLYHNQFKTSSCMTEISNIVFDRITFDDHTEKQVKFIQGLNTDNCIFLWCDCNYSKKFSQLISEKIGSNRYHSYEYQHVSENSPDRKYFRNWFKTILEQEPRYLEQVKRYFRQDYELIEQVKFYDR
jgi:hypothetical protein